MVAYTMCSAADCPSARICDRHADSGRAPAPRQVWDRWHWRRSSFSDRVVCNGFEPAPVRSPALSGER